ncbi:MAG TPA: cellulose biosynthesis protein CelD, partial [Phenylobacterium sp.]
MAPIEIEVVSPSALTAEDLASWRRLQAASPDHRSPFLSPDWICAVARLHGPDRQGARIAVLRRNGEAVGFLPVRVGRGRAIPAGAPFCDYG